MGESNEFYLGRAKPLKSILHMCIPLLAAMCVNVIANLVDSFFIGQLNDSAALAAVAFALPFMAVMVACGDLIGIGSGAAVSRSLGAGERARARKVSATSMAAAGAIGIVLAVAITLFLEPLCAFLGARGDMLAPTMIYIGILAIGAPISLIGFVLDQNVRSEGAAKASAKAAIVSTAANVVLDAIFIMGFGWGIEGAALATVASWLVMFVYLVAASGKCTAQSFRASDISLERSLLKDIFGIGFSGFAMALMLAASSWLLDLLAAGYSTEAVAAIGIALRIENLVGLFAIAFGQGAMPLFAYAFAAKDAVRLKALMKTTLVVMFGALGISAALIFTFMEPIISVFSTDPLVIRIGIIAILSFVSASVVSAGFDFILGLMQAFGKGAPASVLPVMRGCASIALFLIGNALFGLTGLLTSWIAAEGISLLVALCFTPMLRRTIESISKPEAGTTSALPQAVA